MKKTAKPLTIGEARQWQNPKFNKTIYYHKITFDNGDSGEFSTSASPQVKFAVGVEATYTIEPKTKDGVVVKDKFGKETYVIDIFKENTFGGGRIVMTKPSECRSIAASVALKCSRICLCKKDNITHKHIMTLADYFYFYLISGNIIYTDPVSKFEDNNNQIAIQKQTALSEACDYYSDKLVKKEDIILLAKEYYEYISFKSNTK